MLPLPLPLSMSMSSLLLSLFCVYIQCVQFCVNKFIANIRLNMIREKLKIDKEPHKSAQTRGVSLPSKDPPSSTLMGYLLIYFYFET